MSEPADDGTLKRASGFATWFFNPRCGHRAAMALHRAKAGPSASRSGCWRGLLFFVPQGLVVTELASRFPQEGGSTSGRSARWARRRVRVRMVLLINNVLYYPTCSLHRGDRHFVHWVDATFLGKARRELVTTSPCGTKNNSPASTQSAMALGLPSRRWRAIAAAMTATRLKRTRSRSPRRA